MFKTILLGHIVRFFCGGSSSEMGLFLFFSLFLICLFFDYPPFTFLLNSSRLHCLIKLRRSQVSKSLIHPVYIVLCVQSYVHCSIVCNRPDLEAAQVPISGGVDKKAVAYLHNEYLFENLKF